MSTSILSLFQSPTYGSALADVAQASMRPNFEVQFAALQNQVINRVNKEIAAANEDTGKIDAFLLLEKNRTERALAGIEDFGVSVTRNHNTLADIGDQLGDIGGLVDGAAGGDTAAFDKLLAQINSTTDALINVDGVTTGILFEDGIASAKSGGMLRKANGEKATGYADFADANEAKAAIVVAIDRLRSVQTLTDIKIDVANGIQEKVGSKLASLGLQIEAARTASAAEKADTVAKVKEKYAELLQSLSLGFEGNAAMADYFAKHLLSPAEVDRGSVMNLFT